MSHDLFDETTMTFGEHLEELRVHLWKALIGLGVGIVLALFIAKPLIKVIEKPAQDALEEHYKEHDYSLAGENRETPAQEDDVAQQAGSQPEDQTMDLTVSVEELRSAGFVLEPPAGQTEVTLSVRPSRRFVQDVVEPMITRLRRDLFTMNPQEMFLVFLKVSFVTGLVISSPWVFYQVWMFVAAGLYPHERRYAHVFLPMIVGLFLAGVLFCFFAVIPVILNYLLMFNRWLGVAPMIRISEWISFAVMLPLMFGIAFQLPMVMLFLERVGIFDLEVYQSKRRIAVVVIAVLAMMFTPPDPISMLAMLTPLALLYEGGILLVKLMRRRSPFESQVPVP